MKTLNLALVGAACLLAGCATAATPLTGFLYTSVKHGNTATSAPAGSKSGESCATSILGVIATGDSSIDSAAKAAGVGTVSHVDHTSMSVLGIYAEYCTIVYGQ